MPEFIFTLSMILLSYTYVGYPLVLAIISRFTRFEIRRGSITPEVCVIIPVHNEETQIARKLQNCLAFDYPKDKLKIIIVSDSSSDRTEDIVKNIQSNQVHLLRLSFRGGKVVAQNYAVQFCESEIIIFSDVAILNDKDCVKLIVQSFNDRRIGVVSCRDVIVGKVDQTLGERSYINYDMWVRRYASRMGSIIGVTGGFYAVRKEIAKGGWNPAFPPDFYVALRCIKRGLVVVEDSRVKAYYKTAAQESDELGRKVRTINRGMHALFSNIQLLNPFRFGIISWQLISHKVLRWLTPFFLISLFVSNILLLNMSALVCCFFALQVLLYVAASMVCFSNLNKRKNWVLKLLLYFVISNAAIVKSWLEFLVGKKYIMWNPTRR